MYELKQDRVLGMPVYRLTFGGFIRNDEMKEWVEASQSALAGAPAEFGVIVDMRELKALDAETQKTMEAGQRLYKQKGMVRSAVFLAKTVVKMQFERIAKESGIHEWERYFSADEPQAARAMERWVAKAA